MASPIAQKTEVEILDGTQQTIYMQRKESTITKESNMLDIIN